MTKYVCALIAVKDIARSRQFYEGLLKQRVQYDLGVNVSFEGGFAIHERNHFEGLLGQPLKSTAFCGELYFEDDDIEAVERKLGETGQTFVHGIREQPWAQRVLRCLDPDGHIVEVGERMEAVVKRLAAGGMDEEAVATRIGMPVEFVRGALSGAN